MQCWPHAAWMHLRASPDSSLTFYIHSFPAAECSAAGWKIHRPARVPSWKSLNGDLSPWMWFQCYAQPQKGLRQFQCTSAGEKKNVIINTIRWWSILVSTRFWVSGCPVSCAELHPKIPAPAWALWPNVLPVIICLLYTAASLDIFWNI